MSIDLARADATTTFACTLPSCGYACPLGPKFPTFATIVARHQHLDDRTVRQRVVDAMSAWFFEWSAPD